MNGIENIVEYGEGLWQQAREIWLAGDWAMVAIAAVALLMFALGMHVLLGLRRKDFLAVPEAYWRRWIDHPEERRGHTGHLLDEVAGAQSLEETAARFEALRAGETAPVERYLKVMKICVGTAPLLGLLGTVTGMLATFGALATGAGGGDEAGGVMASGISEALITTETGLVIALPGLFFHHQLARMHERYRTFLAHLETVCTQHVYRRLHGRLTPRDEADSAAA